MNIKTKDLDVVCFEALTELPEDCTILGQIHNCGVGQIKWADPRGIWLFNAEARSTQRKTAEGGILPMNDEVQV